ncbi:MAG: dihydropyrimidine dehydrogenase, partial [Spirochaetales bacterium]
MPEYPVPESESQFEENFRQIHPLMKDTEAYYESSRCLFCYNAPCTLACPTRIDVPLFIRQINTGNVAGAARTIYSANYLGGVCGKVCPTEELCEGACVFNKQDVKAIEIGRLQFYAVNKVVSAKSRLFDVPSGKVTGGKIAGGKIA